MKKRVEERFAQDMKDVCEPKCWVQRRACKGAANLYVYAVKKYPANKPTDPEAVDLVVSV